MQKNKRVFAFFHLSADYFWVWRPNRFSDCRHDLARQQLSETKVFAQGKVGVQTYSCRGCQRNAHVAKLGEIARKREA